MFVAWRDLKFARGRFVLIGTVVALITLLVGFLSGLTLGLADQNVSGLTELHADRIVFSAPAADEALSYADSAVTGADAEAGRLTLPESAAADLGVEAGDTVDLAGSAFTVDSVTADSWSSHTPVVWLPLTDWQDVAPVSGRPGIYASVLAVRGAAADVAAADLVVGTSSTGVLQSLTALEAFRSEIGSLLLMVAMLFGISALVVGAFFTVWSVQRQPDMAVLKALGASSRMLVVAMFALGLAGAAFALRSVTSADPLTALGSNR